MTFNYVNNLNTNGYPYRNNAFRGENSLAAAAIEKPIEKITDTIETEKKKKSNRTALGVGASILVLTGIVALLNPNHSAKFIKNLQKKREDLRVKIEQHSGNMFKTRVYKFFADATDFVYKSTLFSNNFNSIKDRWFKKLCTEKKPFYNIRKPKKRKFYKKWNEKFTKVMGKLHNKITRFADSIAKFTVKLKYKKSRKKFDRLDELINSYLKKLPKSEQLELQAKLEQISAMKGYLTDEAIMGRLKEQEKLMENLEKDFDKKLQKYQNGLNNKWQPKGNFIMKNMSFWAQDILKEPQELLNAQSRETLDKIICSDGKNKGLYNTVAEKLMPHLNDAEKRELNRVMAKAESSLNKANETECIKYFDKKRDLTLGSAPTDVVTAVVSVGAAGVALASADNKEKRTSRTITKVIPALAGVGTSIALTAGLVSGFKGIAIGFGSGLALSKIGSFIDKQVFGNNSDETVNKSSLKEKKVYA